ncbi:MAG: restriction endonuclease subunit S, partial [Flavobacterium sp.]
MEKVIPKLRFPEFNGNWEEKKISEISKIARGKSKHRPRNASILYGGKYPFIQTGDIREADLHITSYNQTYSEEGLKQSKLWNENTLCITIAANIAETAILKIKACFPDSIIGLIPFEDKSDVYFIKYQFDKFKIDIQKLSQGVAQDNLNQEKLSNIIFNIPSLPEQQKIATFLTSVDERLTLLAQQKEKLELYKKGVMQQIFAQKLRFKDENGNTYPDWEEKKLGEI